MFKRFRKKSGSTGSLDSYTRGMLMYRRRRYGEALDAFEPLCSQTSPLGQTARNYAGLSNKHLGYSALKTGDYESAMKYFEAGRKLLGSKAEFAEKLADLYAYNNKHSSCESALEKIVAANKNDAAVMCKLSQSQWRAGNFTQAWSTLNRAISSFPDDARLYLQAGIFESSQGDYGKAVEYFSKSIDSDCSYWKGHYYHGLSLLAIEDHYAALRSLQRAFQLAPDNLVLARQLAMAAMYCKNNGMHFVLHIPEPTVKTEATCMKQFVRYVTSEPEFLDAVMYRADVNEDRQLFQMLRDVVDLGITENPKYSDLYYYSGVINYKLDDLVHAQQRIRKAVSLNPRYVKALMLLAELCAGEENEYEAVEHLKLAIACGADWPDVHCMTAELLHKVKNEKEARKHAMRALKLKPEYTRARRILADMAA